MWVFDCIDSRYKKLKELSIFIKFKLRYFCSPWDKALLCLWINHMIKYTLSSWESKIRERVFNNGLNLWIVNKWYSTTKTPNHTVNIVDCKNFLSYLLFLKLHCRFNTLEYWTYIGSNLYQSSWEWFVKFFLFSKGFL